MNSEFSFEYGPATHAITILTASKFTARYAVNHINSVFDMKFAMCSLHSENLKWITAYNIREEKSACHPSTSLQERRCRARKRQKRNRRRARMETSPLPPSGCPLFAFLTQKKFYHRLFLVATLLPWPCLNPSPGLMKDQRPKTVFSHDGWDSQKSQRIPGLTRVHQHIKVTSLVTEAT